MNKILSALTEGREAGVSELAQVDQSIATLSGLPDSKDNPAIPMLLKGRDRLQLQLDELDRATARIKSIQDGNLPLEGQGEGNPKQVIPGQYMGMKLSTAVQAYFSERGRGPIHIDVIVKDIIAAGFQIMQDRAVGPNRGKPRDPNTRDLRLLAQNNRKRFQYNVADDTISMCPAPGNDTAWSPPVLKKGSRERSQTSNGSRGPSREIGALS